VVSSSAGLLVLLHGQAETLENAAVFISVSFVHAGAT
jgi:hypothetical protein